MQRPERRVPDNVHVLSSPQSSIVHMPRRADAVEGKNDVPTNVFGYGRGFLHTVKHLSIHPQEVLLPGHLRPGQVILPTVIGRGYSFSRINMRLQGFHKCISTFKKQFILEVLFS